MPEKWNENMSKVLIASLIVSVLKWRQHENCQAIEGLWY